jgi:branched-chain amino acid transport system ATP-binding protein
MLKIENLSASYGGLRALVDISLQVPEGQCVAIAGPNGAGKTTLFKAISGVVPAQSGNITFDGHDLLRLPPAQRAHLGIAHVPEGWQVFKSMTVYENLEMGALPERGRAEWERNIEQIFALFPLLKERRDQLAGTLSGGQQQMLAVGRGLASSPRLLMLDEPSMGLSPLLVETIFERIAQIHRETGLTVLLVEQRAAEALELCDYGYVIESGRLVLEGTRSQLLSDERVKNAYLGG